MLYLDPDATLPTDPYDYYESTTAGAKLRETGITHWPIPNSAATNESGFTAIPCGIRDHEGTFSLNSGYDSGEWWSSTHMTEYSVSYDDAWSRAIPPYGSEVIKHCQVEDNGFSIRCLMDN